MVNTWISYGIEINVLVAYIYYYLKMLFLFFGHGYTVMFPNINM